MTCFELTEKGRQAFRTTSGSLDRALVKKDVSPGGISAEKAGRGRTSPGSGKKGQEMKRHTGGK